MFQKKIIIIMIGLGLMLSGCYISGNISDNGKPLAGITVKLTGSSQKTATTDSKGNYRFSFVMKGGYIVLPTDSKYAFSPDQQMVTLKSFLSPVKNINFTTMDGKKAALVLVNSMSDSYSDWRRLIEPYMINFGIQCTVLDIATDPVPSDLSKYSVLIIGHRTLDTKNAFLSAEEQASIADAVASGIGLVNFDNDLVKVTKVDNHSVDISCVNAANHDTNASVTPPGGAGDVTWFVGSGAKQNKWIIFNGGGRPFSSMFASTNQANLPVMRFFANGIENGEYKVFATLYSNECSGATSTYFYSYNSANPAEKSVSVPRMGATQVNQHTEVQLDNITISTGSFNLYTRNIALGTGCSYEWYGWAKIRLEPVDAAPIVDSKGYYKFVDDIFGFKYAAPSNDSGIMFLPGYNINCWEARHQSPKAGFTSDVNVLTASANKGSWIGFAYGNRPFATVMAYDTDTKLPVMNFHAENIPNGQYEVYATVYASYADCTYYYGTTAANPRQYSFTTQKTSPDMKWEHLTVKLENANITDNKFNLFVQSAHYATVDYFFGWAAVKLVPVTPPAMHYITAKHSPGESITMGTIAEPQVMDMAAISVPQGSATKVLAATGGGTGTPFISVASFGQGRAVQFGTYDFIKKAFRGPVYGFDDLVWRSIVWAAKKPFIMQGMPPFVSMRVDDCRGPIAWADTAIKLGFKPYLAVFLDYFRNDPGMSAKLASMVNAGNATTNVHAFSESRKFYWDGDNSCEYAANEMAENFKIGDNWHKINKIPVGKAMVPHFYEIGGSALKYLKDWNMEYLITQMEIGTPYGSPWLTAGPYRLYEKGASSEALPMYYADYIRVTDNDYREFDEQFFACVTEIRDDAGYEWSPNADVAGSIGRGTRQLKRSFDSMVMATLFTHEYFMNSSGGGIPDDKWVEILNGIKSNIKSYNPQYVTYDFAADYINSIYHSDIASWVASPSSVTVSLSGKTKVPTKFYMFIDYGSQIYGKLVDVPKFDGKTTVTVPLQ